MDAGEGDAHHAVERRLLQLDVQYIVARRDHAEELPDCTISGDVGIQEDAVHGELTEQLQLIQAVNWLCRPLFQPV